MKPPYGTAVVCLLGLGLAAYGCAGPAPGPQDPPVTYHRPDQTIRDAQAEATALRADLAATRIAAAKKDAEVEELRRELKLQQQAQAQRQQQYQQQADAQQRELVALRTERDKLTQTQTEAQIQLAELPLLRQTALDAKLVEAKLGARMKELETTLTALMTELAEVKKELAERRPSPAVKNKLKAAPTGLIPSGEKPSGEKRK